MTHPVNNVIMMPVTNCRHYVILRMTHPVNRRAIAAAGMAAAASGSSTHTL
jgi:hypothetical protein